MGTHQIEMESYVIDQIRCPECGLTCLQKNIYRHMNTIHHWNREDCKVLIAAIKDEKKNRESTSYVCSWCRVLFRSVRHLVQHKRICTSQPQSIPDDDSFDNGIFEDEIIVEGEEEVVGYQDEEAYQMSENKPEVEKPSTSSTEQFPLAVAPHRQAIHQEKPIQTGRLNYEKHPKFSSISGGNRHRGAQINCPECPEIVESVEDLLKHCQKNHETATRKFRVEQENFQSRDDFKKWFDQRQEDTCTSLTKRTGHGGETLYRCHRVGKYQSVAKSRKSNPRKIDQTCTAYLKVYTEEDGLTWAYGCFTHIGHELDHKLLWLTETQENYVKELINLGWNSDAIYFYIRSEYNDYECKLKYISKNDIRNITVRYNRQRQKYDEILDASRPNRDEIDPEFLRETHEIEPKKARRELPAPKVAQEAPKIAQEEEEIINVVDDEETEEMPKLEEIRYKN